MTIQAHGLDLDEWGAQGVMASVDVFYQGILAPYLHVKPSLSWPEVCETVWNLIKLLVTPEITRRQLAEGWMDIYHLFLVFTQMFEKILDRVVQRLLLAQFPLWVQEGDLDTGYAFMNKADETFQLLTHQDPHYEDFHQFLDRSVQRALHPKIKGYAPRGNQTNDRLPCGFTQKKTNAPEHCGNQTPGHTSSTSPSEGHNKPPANRHATSGNCGPFCTDAHRTEVEEPAPDTDTMIVDSNGADGPTDM
ncbi:hypothetical protein H4R20_000793 [Coemansia guatemalensis]|uniref:Uncharacterized protein n=1 Tax=Coemansia guatemalensis TaxID=2761395 RepID=A0A9W8HY94_9FUNG|nr:hypothetical protein H4R20_000793 [Coemansia guatemalensis]